MAFSPETYALLKGIAIDAAASATTASDAADTATGAAEQAAASAAASAANSGLAPAFDAASTYAIGDLVLYDGAVYRFTAAHTGAWDAGDVEQTTLGEEVEALDAAKANKTDVATADAALEQMILAAFPTDSISNVAVASFSDGADNIPVKSLTVNITPVQAGSGDPSPTNVRPISGWTGANIGNSNVAFTENIPSESGYYGDDGVYHTSATTKYTTNYTQTYPNASGKIEGIYVEGSAASIQRVYFYDANKTWIGRSEFPTGGTQLDDDWTLEFITPNNCAFVRFQFTTSMYVAHFSTLSYSVKAVAITFPSAAGTVYGGTLRDNGDRSWTLTVTQILAQLKWGDGTNPQVGDSYERRTFENAFADIVQTNGTDCPNNIGIPYATAGDYARYYIATNGKRVQMYLPNSISNDLVVQIIGNLATPVTFTLTAESVKTLLGHNNIFADCGDIAELIYRVSPDDAQEEQVTIDTELNRRILASFPTDSITDAAVASFPDGADGIPVKSLTVDITPVQSGSGDPSPTNVRPISGWTGADITTGKNMYNSANAEAGYISASGEISQPNIGRHSPLIPVNEGDTYTFSAYLNADNNTTNVRVHAYDASGNFIEQLGAQLNVPAHTYCKVTVTIPTGTRFIRVSYNVAYENLMVEAGSERTGYVAYASKSIQFPTPPGTVYGGTLTDNGDGTWTLVKTMVCVDMGTMTWGASSQSGCFYTNSINDYKNVNNMVFYCSEYKPDGHGSTGDLYGVNNTIRYFLSESTGSAFNVHDNAQAGKTGEQFASAVSGAILVYELATPAAPITLTAESVRTLLGQNNIFADCGDIAALTYRADPTLYIAKKLATVLPADPTTDGAYVLTDTVSDGAATKSWESNA